MPELTLDQIALMAGVSKATISRVLNKSPHVAEATRQRVQEIIDQTGFLPNRAAQVLATQRTNVLGLVIPRHVESFTSDPYFPHLVQGVTQFCNQNGYSLNLLLLHSKNDEQLFFSCVLQRGILDGVIVQSTGLTSSLTQNLEDWAIPYVFVGRPNIPQEVSYVDVDNFNGAYQAVLHLIDQGYKRIGTVTGDMNTTPGIDRLAGYKQALESRGITFEEKLVARGNFTESSAYDVALELIDENPDALFVASDTMAVGALRALQDVGLRVPEDMALMGYDDLPPATLSTPQLSTVQQPIREMGIRAVEMLLEIMKDGSEPKRRIIFTPKVVVRDSTGVQQSQH